MHTAHPSTGSVCNRTPGRPTHASVELDPNEALHHRGAAVRAPVALVEPLVPHQICSPAQASTQAPGTIPRASQLHIRGQHVRGESHPYRIAMAHSIHIPCPHLQYTASHILSSSEQIGQKPPTVDKYNGFKFLFPEHLSHICIL